MADMTFYNQPAIEESVSAVTTDPTVPLGTRRIWKGEEYVYCYNAGGVSINATYGGNMITGASGYSIAGTGVTDAAIACIGVIKHATLTTAAYGWVMVKGWSNVHTANSTITGNIVQIGACVAVANYGGAFGLASGPTTNNACGFALNADTASAGTMYAFIQTGF